jgi:hypothetical protein
MWPVDCQQQPDADRCGHSARSGELVELAALDTTLGCTLSEIGLT